MGSFVLKGLILFMCVCVISASKIDFCSDNVFNSSLQNNYLQFTKELSSSEYALTSTFKSLHCCARGYRSIQWFKDGKPYPWSSEVSTFILYPDAANQTIYARSLATVHSGNYTCQISNDSETIAHTIKFNVFGENGYSDNPLSTYNLPAEQYVRLGDTARLYCEAFIGKINLPDAESDIFWTRPGMNESQVLKNPRVHVKYVPRDDEQIIGLYFFIKNIKRSDFGEYICHVSNSNDQETVMRTTLVELDWNGERRNFDVPWLKVILIISVVLALFMCVVLVFQHVFLSVLLFFKSSCCSNYNESGKVYDILVCYISSDTEFIKTTLAVTLHKKYGYNVSYKQLIDPNLAPTANQSRCILLIGSPGMCNNDWTPKSIYSLLKYLTSMSNNVVFIPVKPIPSGELLKSDDGRKLEEILKKISVVQFYGNSKSDMRMFWIKLRLALPSKKRNFQIPSVSAVSDQLVQTANQSVSTKVNFLMLTKSKEGAEVLV